MTSSIISEKRDIQLSDYVVHIQVFDNNKNNAPNADSDKQESITIRMQYDRKPRQEHSSSSHLVTEFVDELVVRHPHRSFLMEVVHTLYACFSTPAITHQFIHFDVNTKSFCFAFDRRSDSETETESPALLSCLRSCALSRSAYTKQEAIDAVKDANRGFDAQYRPQSSRDHNEEEDAMQVECVNAHQIYEPLWELEVTLNVVPGLYHFKVPELLSCKVDICVRDYRHIRYYYTHKLSSFYREHKIYRHYLDHLHVRLQKNKFMWSMMGFETGSMQTLYNILRQIPDEDVMWATLFELCSIDEYTPQQWQQQSQHAAAINGAYDGVADGDAYDEDDDDYKLSRLSSVTVEQSTREKGQSIAVAPAEKSNISDYVTEQSVANFIALSIQFYALDRKLGGLQEADKHLDTLDLASLLSACDKYLLSLVLPYFDVRGLRRRPTSSPQLHQRLRQLPRISGMFNRFVNFDAITEPETWQMDIENADAFKHILLRQLRYHDAAASSRNVPRTFKPVQVVKHSWTYAYDASSHTFTVTEDDAYDYERQGSGSDRLYVVDDSDEQDWCMWFNKALHAPGNGKVSPGYWAILDEFQSEPRVPCKHLDVIRTLMTRVREIAQEVAAVGVKIVENASDDKHNRDCEYRIVDSRLNGAPFYTATLCVKIVKAWLKKMDTPKKKKKEQYFMWYPSLGAHRELLEWSWHDNDRGVYEVYNLGELVVKQLEAAYQATKEHNFPLSDYCASDAKHERKFAKSTLTELTAGMVRNLRVRPKDFFVRFTFFDDGQPMNMEQIAVNNNFMFPRNIRRVVIPVGDNQSETEEKKSSSSATGAGGALFGGGGGSDDYDGRMYSLGKMCVSMLQDDFVRLSWMFPKSDEKCVDRKYTFECCVKAEKSQQHTYADDIKHCVQLWRNNHLFEHREFRIAVNNEQYLYHYQVPKIEETREENSDNRRLVEIDAEFTQEFTMDGDKQAYQLLQIDRNRMVTFKSLKNRKPQTVALETIATKTTLKSSRRKVLSVKIHDLPKDYHAIISNRFKSCQMQSITDAQWGILDALDDGQTNVTDTAMRTVYESCHRRDRFCAKIFDLVSLQKIQSVVSVLKQHIQKTPLQCAFVVAVSDQQMLFNYDSHTTHVSSFETSLARLIEHDRDSKHTILKRIDSKQIIYDLTVQHFERDVISKHYLHDFLRVASQVYQSTLFIFTRPNSQNIYIAHNAMLCKLSLQFGDEDLYYFLPSFIALKRGDFVAVETFGFAESGTVIEVSKSRGVDQTLYYGVRTRQNILYTLNYHQLTRRISPHLYFRSCRKAIQNANLSNLSLSATDPMLDLSDPSHPLHVLGLSIFESSKQTLSRLNGEMEAQRLTLNDIQHRLQHSGVIYLLYRTVHNAVEQSFDDKTRQLLGLQKERFEIYSKELDEFNAAKSRKQKNKVPKPTEPDWFIAPDLLDSFDNTQTADHLDGKGLERLLRNLESKKLIFNKREMESNLQAMSFENLLRINETILKETNQNKIYMIHVKETRSLQSKPIELDSRTKTEQFLQRGVGTGAANLGGNQLEIDPGALTGNETDMEVDDDDWAQMEDEDDEFATVEIDDDNQVKAVVSEDKESKAWRIEVQTEYECSIECSYEMSIVHSSARSVGDLLETHRDVEDEVSDTLLLVSKQRARNKKRKILKKPSKWSVDENRLVTFLHQYGAYNEYDLLDKGLVQRLHTTLLTLYAQTATPKYRKLLTKFEEFMSKVLKNQHNDERRLNAADYGVVNGVAVTRNAVLLRSYLAAYEAEKEEAYLLSMSSSHTLSSVALTTTSQQHSSRRSQKSTLTLLRMPTFPSRRSRTYRGMNRSPKGDRGATGAVTTMVVSYNPLQSVTLSTHRGIDITHPVHLYRNAYSPRLHNFCSVFDLEPLYTAWMGRPLFGPSTTPNLMHIVCHQKKMLPPTANVIDALAQLIRYNKHYELLLVPSSVTLSAAFLAKECVMIAPDHAAIAHHRVTFVHKGLIYKHRASEDFVQGDADNVRETDEGFFLDAMKMLIRTIKTQIVENAPDFMEPIKSLDTIARLRACVPRNLKDIRLRWIKIGCGTCFVHEPFGRTYEIGPPQNYDYDVKFPSLLKEAMFDFFIDCQLAIRKVASSPGDDVGDEKSQSVAAQTAIPTCYLCQNYAVDPCIAVNKHKNTCARKHMFCKKCLEFWLSLKHNPEFGSLMKTRKAAVEHNQANLAHVIRRDNDKETAQSVFHQVFIPEVCPGYLSCFHGDVDTVQSLHATEMENEMNRLPMTIQQQLRQENELQFARLDLLHKYQMKRELELQQEIDSQRFSELIKRPEYASIAAGYGYS